jgi:hypothetical protein
MALRTINPWVLIVSFTLLASAKGFSAAWVYPLRDFSNETDQPDKPDDQINQFVVLKQRHRRCAQQDFPFSVG